jgi:large subunit ribosomal protein L21
VGYAIVRAGDKQFRVNVGEVIEIPSIDADVGSSIELETLLAADGDAVQVGAGGPVTATVVKHGRAPKVVVFKKKRRKQYKKTRGHRQGFTSVRIESIGK